MGVLECGAMAMTGYFDVFDRAIGAIEGIEKRLAETQILAEYHHKRISPDGEHEVKAHIFDPKGEMQAELDRAKKLIAEACEIAQNVMSEM